jgi:hypothetical protein
VVVLDNYQDIAAGAVLQEVIRTAVAEVPPGCSILCISRSDALAVSERIHGSAEELQAIARDLAA